MLNVKWVRQLSRCRQSVVVIVDAMQIDLRIHKWSMNQNNNPVTLILFISMLYSFRNILYNAVSSKLQCSRLHREMFQNRNLNRNIIGSTINYMYIRSEINFWIGINNGYLLNKSQLKIVSVVWHTCDNMVKQFNNIIIIIIN